MTDKFDNKGWAIDRTKLWTPDIARSVDDDKLFENQDKNFACLFYNIDEYRMGSYAALIGLFESKSRPSLLINLKNQWFDYQGERSLTFYSDILFLRKPAYNENPNLSGTPFCIFDLNKKVFGFVDFDATSIYYTPIKIQADLYKFNLDYRKELESSRIHFPSRHDSIFDLSTIKYYSFSQLDRIMELYVDEKLNAC